MRWKEGCSHLDLTDRQCKRLQSCSCKPHDWNRIRPMNKSQTTEFRIRTTYESSKMMCSLVRTKLEGDVLCHSSSANYGTYHVGQSVVLKSMMCKKHRRTCQWATFFITWQRKKTTWRALGEKEIPWEQWSCYCCFVWVESGKPFRSRTAFIE